MKKLPRIYVDTSVFGGVFDEEFRNSSKKLFEQIVKENFLLTTSYIVYDEIHKGPIQVQSFFDRFFRTAEVIPVNDAVEDLSRSYIDHYVVMKKSINDSLHVALATVGSCSMIVSWNFKHIVHYDKMQKYNAVNLMNGYQNISIVSPLEVIDYE